MPVQGNAGVPEVTAAHGTVVQRTLSVEAASTTPGVLSAPISGLGRVQVACRWDGIPDNIWPGQMNINVYGLTAMVASWADLLVMPVYYQIDSFALVQSPVNNWSGGTYAYGFRPFAFNYPVFAPFIAVVLQPTTAPASTVTVTVTIMGVTG